MRRYANIAEPITLSAAVDNIATTLTVASTSGFPEVPFLIGLERGTANEEVVLCTAKDATTFTVTRGYDGTTAVSHAIGSQLEHTVAAIDYREAGIVRITTADRDALAGNELWEGRTIYNTDTDKLEYYDGTNWVNVGPRTGTIAPYAGASAPTGTLLCDGSAVSRTTYADLFALVGTTYGVGDGATTFNLPDLRQRFPLGKAASGTGSVLADTGGSIDHTHAGPSHSHTNPNTGSSGSHAHNQGSTGTSGSHSHSQNNTGTAGAHDHGGDTGTSQIAAQGGRNFEGGASGHDHPISSGGNHSHSNPSTNSSGNHSHTIPNDSAGSHTHSVGNTGLSGTGATGSANPPYLVVQYVIYV